MEIKKLAKYHDELQHPKTVGMYPTQAKLLTEYKRAHNLRWWELLEPLVEEIRKENEKEGK